MIVAELRADPTSGRDREGSGCSHPPSVQRKTNDGVDGGLLSRSIRNLPLNEPVHATERYRKTTAGQIRNAFAKWIQPSGFVQITMGAEPGAGGFMKENKIITCGNHAVSSTDEGTDGSASSPYETSGGIIIDFHSADFNQMDYLNDCSGNYRTFQPLDGVVTADMRHQMERRSGRDAVDTAVDDAVPSKKIEGERNEVATPDAAPSFTVISRGRTLIVAKDAERSIAYGKFLSEQGLACTLLVTQKGPDASLPRFDQFRLLEVDAVSITGAFGGFSAMVTAKGDQQPLSEWFGDEASFFDLVLDLQSTPSYAGDGLPMGYYAPGTNPVTLHEVMAELPEMRGRFRRPQFTAFLKNRCLHSRSRTLDCRQCLAVCPFDAIQSVDRTISIVHYRCQGCGGCVLVCPADAIQMIHPSQEEQLNILRRTLEDRSKGAAVPSTLVISDLKTVDGHTPPGMDEGNHGRRIHFEVEQIGHVGLEMLLVALAYGVGKVVVACGAQNPLNIRKAAEWQAQMGSAILRGLGIPEDKIRFAVIPPANNRSEKVIFATTGPEARPDEPRLQPATFSPKHDKRTLIRLATQHLYDQSGTRQPSIPLPAGSPFGAVTVDSTACTLCMACAVACPSGALSTKGDVPRLEFLESRCHQCGLCGEACPEGAMLLLPRMLCDLDAVEAPAILNEAEPFRCIKCGVPFASQAMIKHIQGKLTGHWMYAADQQLRRLQMCRTCRTRDALLSQDMKSWNP
jgi:ferredoxin